MGNIIQKELRIAKTKMFEEVTYNNKKLVKLTTDNVAIVEAMIRNDSAYINQQIYRRDLNLIERINLYMVAHQHTG